MTQHTSPDIQSKTRNTLIRLNGILQTTRGSIWQELDGRYSI